MAHHAVVRFFVADHVATCAAWFAAVVQAFLGLPHDVVTLAAVAMVAFPRACEQRPWTDGMLDEYTRLRSA